MLVPVLLFIVGLLFLIKGGDWFVDGASALARRFHLPELLIGATVVSIGTTLPEVMVSTMSAVSGHGEIAYGNAIGSVICNAALIAAITIAVRPGKVDPKSLRTPVAFFFVAAAFYAGVAYTTGSFTRPVGLILLAMFAAYIICNVMAMKNAPAPEEEEEPEENADIQARLLQLKQKALEVLQMIPQVPQELSDSINGVTSASLLSDLITGLMDLSPEENEAAMTEAIETVRTGEVTYAVRDTVIDDHEIHQGDYMGIGDAGILAVGQAIETVTKDMIDSMMDEDMELISIYYGQETKEEDAAALRDKVAEKYPACDVELQYGGQPIYYYIVSAE